MKLRTRFVLGFLAVGLITFVMGMAALQVLGEINREFSTVQHDIVPSAISMLETEAAVQSMLVAVNRYIQSGHQDFRLSAQEDIAFIQESVGVHLEHGEELGGEEAESAREVTVRAAYLVALAEDAMDIAADGLSAQDEANRNLEQMDVEIEQVSAVWAQYAAADKERLASATILDLSDQETSDAIQELISLYETEAALQALRGNIQTMAISGDLKHRERVREAGETIRQLAADARSMEAEERSAIQNIEVQVTDRVLSLADGVMGAIESNASAKAHLNGVREEIRERSMALDEFFAEKVAEHNDELAAAEVNVSRNYSVSTLVIWIAIGIALLTCVGVALVLARIVLRPISRLSAAAESIAGGNMDVEVDIKDRSEVGVLATAFNQMVARLRQMVQSEQVEREHLETTVRRYVDYAVEVGGGNLSARLSLDDEVQSDDDPLIQLGQQLNWMTASLQKVIVQISGVAGNLSSAAAEILASTAQQVSGASEQSAAISQTTTTVDEVRNIAEQTVLRAQEVAGAARRSVEISGMGEEAVGDTMESMGGIKVRVEGIAENILALSEQTQQIGEIISTVNDIASQSNMLALNASVEAARAGEQGKGFAVVAMEVRSLAEQSRQATQQVEAILSDIQRATNMTVMATEEGTKGVEEGVTLSARTGEVIQQLGGALTQSAQAAVQMVAGGQQQTSGIEQIALAMQNINQATVQSLASTRQAEKTARDLNELARSLQETVERYQ